MNIATQKAVVTPAFRELFKAHWRKYRILYFCAPCGAGKTTLAGALLAGYKVCAYSALEPECLHKPLPADCDAVLIDDFQNLKNPAEQQAVCTWINENPGKHFVFLSRGVLPGWLMPYQFTGLLVTVDAKAMLFDRDAVSALIISYGAAASEAGINELLNDTKGYPLLVCALCRRMAGGAPYTGQLLDETRREIFHYIEDAVYRRFDLPMRRLLLALTPFEAFNAEIAKLASGDSHVNDLLSRILHETTMLDHNGLDNYRFWPLFRRFLNWEMEQECTVEEQHAIYSRAGLYYELHDDYAKALDCYTKSCEHRKVSDLLIKNAEQHPGAAHYDEMERYYFALPREEILRSPSLMCGMSMLTSMCMDYEASEEWYQELQSYAARLKKTDAEYREVRGRLAYLDVSLSQRGSRGLDELLKSLFTILTDKQIKLPAFSVTSCLPSLMNGGKDFCEWSKRDDILYATLRLPVETILGRDGVGLADCAMCESKLEKGEDVSARLLALMSRAGEIRRKGTPDILFAVMGLLVRAQVAQGKALSALDTLGSLREDFIAAEQTRFLPNMDAMRCRVWLRTGELEKAKQWLRDSAPSAVPRFRILLRYQYITKAMVHIACGDHDEALLCLAPLAAYCENCARIMDGLHKGLLTAICHYRMKSEAWRPELTAALTTAEEYGFIAPVSQYGAAILPLITELGSQGGAKYFSRLMSATREQAVNYPDFMRPPAMLLEPLSPAEKQVLRLACHNRSNQQIADTLGIKLPTVKSHMRSILQKLGVSRRSEAKEAAQALHLI